MVAKVMSAIDTTNLAKEVEEGLEDIKSIVPDIFSGAKEAYQLLDTVSKLFSRLDVAI